MGGDGAGTRAACGSAVGVEEQRDKDRRRVDGGGESAVASLFRWIGRLAESAKPATAARQRIHRADSQLIKGTVIEKAMESGRQTISQIKALPKTDDWVTWLGKALNQMTGYTRISELKEKVEESGSEFKVARQSLDALKQQYADTVQQRINNQREINSLLQRKHLWNENDVARFTGLYKDEYQAETVEQDASRRLKEAENAVDLKYDMLVNSIRERYHEEQIWSDKIRRASTYGTWAVLFMNILALFLAQAIFEPRKRRKIIDGVDEKLSRAMLAQQEKLDSVAHSLAAGQQGQERSIGAVAQHLSNVAAVLETVVARQDAQLDVLSGPALGPSTGIGSSIDLGGGYSDSELDVYYAQQRSQDTADKHGFAPAVPGSMIWKAVKPAEKSTGASEQQGDAKTKDDRTFTRAEASQLAIETAAVVGCLAAMVTLYFSS
ncbi:sensitivity to high expression protein she9 [Coemansia sp. RSA 2599]|nr:sensitivity to high expression protein she9 [Coemansia sp. RSA 2599]